jgi:hypothetical protein
MEVGRNTPRGQPWQGSYGNLISSKQTNKKIQVWWSALGKKHRTQPGKQQNKKRAGSMAQVVEYLPHG